MLVIGLFTGTLEQVWSVTGAGEKVGNGPGFTVLENGI